MFNGKRLSGWMALAVFATVGGTMVATDSSFAAVDVDKLTVGGEIRERYEVRTNDTFNKGQTIGGAATLPQKGNESLASQRIRVSVGYNLTPDVVFFAQIQDSRIFGSECAVVNTSSGAQCVSQTNSNLTGVDMHQAYIQLKNVLTPGLSLKVGRQEIIFGDHRLFGNFGWSQTGNSFDGLRLTHSTGMADVDVFWVRPVDVAGTAFQGGNNNIPFPAASAGAGPQADGNQDVYGLYVTLKPVANWTIEPYLFRLADHRLANVGGGVQQGNAITTAQFSGQSRNFLGGRINGKAGAGVVLDFTAEGNYQFGSMMDNCSRNNGLAAACGSFFGAGGSTSAAGAINGGNGARISAEQAAIRTGVTFDAVPMKPRLGFEFDYASGDKCSNGPALVNGCANGVGNTSHLADNLYPTNHFHYGYMDLMSWKNMVNYAIKFDIKPSPVSKLQFDVNIMRLAKTADNWYRAGQAVYFTSKATNQEASLGTELDIHYWHTFKEKFKFEVGVGHFMAGSYITKSTATSINGVGGFANTQGSASNGLGNATQITDQNWGYVMGSILF